VSKSRLTVFLLLIVLCLATGCVYYNTFYHARAASREAEALRESRAPDTDPGQAEKELLERVVEKCGRVLQLHPDSEWADDALLLLGTTHYHQQRYESAESRLGEFLTLYPDSELTPEAQYMLASVLLERGNPVSAETYLEPLANSTPPHPLSDDALALIGRARHERKKYDEAAEAYEQALERFPRGDRRAEIRFLSAGNYEEMGDLDAAAGQYALVPTERGARKLVFEAWMRLAGVDIARGRLDDALDVLGDLERRTEDRDELDRVLLLRGSALEATGAVEDAIATYEGISASHERSDASAEAHYRIGLLHRDHFEQLDEAVTSFRAAKDEAPRSDVARLATDAIGDVEKLKGFLATIAEDGMQGGDAPSDEDVPGEETSAEDSSGETGNQSTDDATLRPDEEPGDLAGEDIAPPTGVVDDSTGHASVLPVRDETEFAEAEAAPEGPDSTDVEPATTDSTAVASATTDSTAVASTPSDSTDVELAPNDSTGLAPAPPDSAATVTAGADTTTVGLADAEEAPEEKSDPVAVARFRAAELYLFRFDDAERAGVYYTAVVENHPDDPLAPKAALALAWIMETREDDARGARAAYRAIISEYPDSDYSTAAQEGLARLDEVDAN
jgi:TolA-binding protein